MDQEEMPTEIVEEVSLESIIDQWTHTINLHSPDDEEWFWSTLSRTLKQKREEEELEHLADIEDSSFMNDRKQTMIVVKATEEHMPEYCFYQNGILRTVYSDLKNPVEMIRVRDIVELE